MVAQVLKVLMVGLLYSCPRREREGAASRPADHDPSVSEGEYTDGREQGKGRGLGSAPWRHSTIMINRYLIERPMRAKRREPSEAPHRALENGRAYLFIIVLMAKRARAEQRGREGRGVRGPGPPGRGARHVFCFILRVLFVFTPPAGGLGGSELFARARPERKRWGVNGQARAGGGWGRG